MQRPNKVKRDAVGGALSSRRPWLQVETDSTLICFVVESLDKMLHNDYLCLMVSLQIKASRSNKLKHQEAKFNQKTWKQMATP